MGKLEIVGNEKDYGDEESSHDVEALTTGEETNANEKNLDVTTAKLALIESILNAPLDRIDDFETLHRTVDFTIGGLTGGLRAQERQALENANNPVENPHRWATRFRRGLAGTIGFALLGAGITAAVLLIKDYVDDNPETTRDQLLHVASKIADKFKCTFDERLDISKIIFDCADKFISDKAGEALAKAQHDAIQDHENVITAAVGYGTTGYTAACAAAGAGVGLILKGPEALMATVRAAPEAGRRLFSMFERCVPNRFRQLEETTSQRHEV